MNTWRVDEIVDKLQFVVVAGVLYRKNFLENLVQSFVFPVLGSSVQLEEVSEGLQLDFEEVRIFKENF